MFSSSGVNAESECVGFADCPCLRCRKTRRDTTDAHKGGHADNMRPYCGVCRTQSANRYYYRRATRRAAGFAVFSSGGDA